MSNHTLFTVFKHESVKKAFRIIDGDVNPEHLFVRDSYEVINGVEYINVVNTVTGKLVKYDRKNDPIIELVN